MIESSDVTIRLAPIIDRVKERLADDGLGLVARIPTGNAVITIYSGDDVASIQRAYDAIDTAGVAIPIIAGILVVAGILLARDRRKATIRTGGAARLIALLGTVTAREHLAHDRPDRRDARATSRSRPHAVADL